MLSTLNEESSNDDATTTTPPDTIPAERAMAMQSTQYQTMMEMFKKMDEKIDRLESDNNRGGRNGGGGNGDGNTNRKTADNPQFTRRKTDKYCWTHGGCAHNSADCTAKAPGHRDTATFSNKIGGSKAFRI